jgi:hypothetical protein
MKYRKFSLMFLLIVFLAGCGTTYVYHGTLIGENSIGEEREFQIRWKKTERPLWFDECDGSIRLLTECSFEKINFDEGEDGIIFECPSSKHIGVTHDVEVGEPCGEILNAKKIIELKEGKLKLKIYCMCDTGGFIEGDHSYLKARDEAYEFDVIREKSSEYEDGVPPPPECRKKDTLSNDTE